MKSPFIRRQRSKPPASPRRRALAEWRGVDVVALEEERARSRPMSEVMPRILKELRMDRRLAETEILKVWNHLIDPRIVAHAQPTGLNKGTLFVRVDSSVWLDEIVRYRRHEILQRLQHSFGEDLVARISFRVG